MALELVGSALLSAFLQVAFEKLASPHVLDFFRRRKLDEKLLNKLKIKLHSIDALADDAEQKQFRDPRVRAWLVAVKDAALDAEDLLDEIQYQLSKCEIEAESVSQTCTGCTFKVPNFFKSSPVSSINREIKSRMEQVLDSLEFLSSQQSALGLKNASGVGVFGSGLGSERSRKSLSTSFVVESVIYGRDDDKEIIFNWLTSDTDNRNKLSVLSIVGMGGMGKTTLAQHVYNDPRIEGKFDSKAWVCVSDDFDVFKVTRAVLERITESTDDSRDLEMVQRRLKENLTGKRFLLVLDDVWNRKQKEWRDLQTPLDYGAQGSKIVVTTRDVKVATIVGSNKIHTLSQLQGDHCWSLFIKHAFQDDNHQQYPDYKETGMKIVEKCKGLPLALTTVGSLLHQKPSISEWESILKSEIWEFSEEDSDIVPALALSYHHLPSHLKRCFAYCSLFPKDYLFDKECLIQFWMAQKFLQRPQQSNRSLEEVGEHYFKDLLSRSFFQQSNFRGKTCFVMHDLLHDLAKYVCGDVCFRLEVVDQAKNIPKTIRHFSVAINHVQHFDGFGTQYDTTRLRTFMPTNERMNSLDYRWHCKMSISELFSKCKFLRVLSLSCCSNLIEVPDSIGNLLRLHSLDLSGTDIEKLPEPTFSLYNLQVLKLNSCENLKELPSNVVKLTSLRRLEIINTELRKVPAHLAKLKNVQVLMSSFDIGRSNEFTIQQLGELNLHGSLSIEKLQNIENPSDALAADLKNKTHLVNLKLKWDGTESDDSGKERDHEVVIENLQPSKHLEELSINLYGGKQFPCWLSDNSLRNMASLKLKNCQSCQSLPSLGLLPFLKCLEISGLDRIVSIDTYFYGSSSCSFTSLQKLKFSYMKEWKRWECESVKGAFPRLQYLSVEYCPKLKGHLPDQLVHLMKLKIWDCKQLVASTPTATEIHELHLLDCGELQFDYHPTTLKRLTVKGHNMDALMLERIGHLISVNSLEYLYVDSCPNMNIPKSGCHGFLVQLSISNGCDSLTTFPLDLFPALRRLTLYKCRNLKIISQGHAHNHLMKLKIKFCPELESLPEDMHILLPALYNLEIEDCPKVESFPDGGLPSNLKQMDLKNGSKLIFSLKMALGANHSLKWLIIGKLDVESIPEEGLLPLSLTSLWITDFPNLKRLDYKGLCQLSSLRELRIGKCPNLKLPEEGLPKSISRLEIWDCPLLKQRCQEPEGEDWPKIVHIQDRSIW